MWRGRRTRVPVGLLLRVRATARSSQAAISVLPRHVRQVNGFAQTTGEAPLVPAAFFLQTNAGWRIVLACIWVCVSHSLLP